MLAGVDRFYFPFPDKRISYDCDACGYQCCKRGPTTSLLPGTELEAVVKLRPRLRPFLHSAATDFRGLSGSEMVTFAPGCLFLDESGRCEVHRDFGRENKPWACRLYPFSEVARIGDCYFVNVHVFGGMVVCPFSVQSAPSDGAIDHSSVASDLRAMPDDHPFWSQAPDCPNLDEDAEKIVATETAIRDELAALGPEATVALVLARAAQLPEVAIADRLAWLGARLGIPLDGDPAREGDRARVLAAIAPMLRAKYLVHYHRQGLAAVTACLPDVLCLAALHADAAATLARSSLSARWLLLLYFKMHPLFHLQSLLEAPTSLRFLDGESRESIALPAETDEARMLLYLLNHREDLTLLESLRMALDLPELTVEQATPVLGALAPAAQFLGRTDAQ